MGKSKRKISNGTEQSDRFYRNDDAFYIVTNSEQ